MAGTPIDPERVQAWVTARSIARGLPAPVLDHGGYRVDTGSAAEVRRWVFARLEPGLAALARTIGEPGYLLKLCGTADALRSALPKRWQIGEPSYFMTTDVRANDRTLPVGYRLETERGAVASAVRVRSATGELAASGHAAETDAAFVYDRIVTAPGHRRRGLGHVVMNALRDTKRVAVTPELLVATEAGRALYETLGWRVLSPYVTASIPNCTGPAFAATSMGSREPGL